VIRDKLGSLRRKSSGPTAQTTVALAGAQVLVALAGVVSARGLGPEGKGIVNAVTSWPQLLSWVGVIGLPGAMSVRLSERPESLPSVLGHAVGYSITAGGVVALGSAAALPRLLSHLGEGTATLTQWSLALIPVTMLVSILMATNLALGRIRRHNFCLLAMPTLLLGGSALLAAAGEITPTSMVATTIAGSLVSFAMAAHGLPWSSLAVDLGRLRDDIRFGVRVHLGSLMSLANLRLDLLLMSLLLPAWQVGLYGTANNAMLPVVVASSGASLLLAPAVARLSAGSKEVAPSTVGQLTKIRREARRHLLVALVAGAVLAMTAPILIRVTFGISFLPAATLIRILIPGYVARVYATVATSGAVGMRKPWVGNCSEACALAITLALLPFLLPRYGATGAAITSSCAYAVSAMVVALALRRLASTPSAVAARRPVATQGDRR
jgi:antigen flippase